MPATSSAAPARAPLLIILCGCAIACLTFGPRATLGLFMNPISDTNGWTRDVFAMSFAIQNLLWGIGQPFAGGIADRFGTRRVLAVGGLLYAAGLALMPVSGDPGAMHFSAGVLIGFALSGASFAIIIGAFGKLLPENWRMMGFGFATAAGSFGQFLFTPLASSLIRSVGWQQTLLIFAVLMLLVLPLSLALASPKSTSSSPSLGADQSVREALKEAFATPSYWLLVIGFFTCGFHLAFITMHLPPFLIDKGLDPSIGGWTLALIGLFNIIGSLSSGALSGRLPKRRILAAIYFARALLITAFLYLPVTNVTALGFGMVIGLLWLSTIPPTSGLVATMFGPRYMTMLYGVVFLSHQIGSFLGAWLGGVVYRAYGSYDLVWQLSIAFAIMSAIVNLPIRERPVTRLPATA